MQYKKIKNKGFTLVELIVVITILAILWTIAFISMQWFAGEARNSTRVSDMSTIERALVFHKTQWWRYPTPEDSVTLSYSGSSWWAQWYFWKEALSILESITSVPIDPLTKLRYSYSLTSSTEEFQLWSVIESEVAFHWKNETIANSFISQSFANTGKLWLALVNGTYNGRILKTTSNSQIYLLSIPSIITNDITTTDIIDTVYSNKLIYNWKLGLPGSYVDQWYSDENNFNFDPEILVLYEWNINGLETIEWQLEFIANFKDAYENTTALANDKEIQNIANIEVDEINPSQELKNVTARIITDNARISVPNYSKIDLPIIPTFWSCKLTEDELDGLIDFFTYASSTLQTKTTAQEWCDLTTIATAWKWLSWDFPTWITKLTNLTWLQMNDNNITGSIPRKLWALVNLERLFIWNNDLSWRIPQSIALMPKLEYLRVYWNNLSGKVPQYIWDIPALEHLQIGRNNFYWALPASIWNMTLLKTLSVEVNDIDTLPDSLANLTNLTAVNFNQNLDLWNLAITSFNKNTPARTEANITDTGKSMTISGNGTTVDISVN